MKRFFQSEIGAAVAWVLTALLAAAAISPWIRSGGLALADAAQSGDLPALLEWLGAACGRSNFSRFFNRALMLCALLLLPLLFRRIRAIRSGRETGARHALVRVPWKSKLARIATGCLISATILWLAGIGLELAGAFVPKEAPPSAGRFLSKTLIPAIAAPLLEEWLFRGVLLGLWLRFAKPVTACVGTSLLFAFVHFLKPPAGTEIADPGHPLAGFELLGKILLHFTDPRFFLTDFATLFAVGLILAWTRVRTGSLWFAIGLHAGWVFAFKSFNLFFEKGPDHFLRPWGVGDSLLSGTIPLLALAATALTCHFALRPFDRRPS